jgi:hypothetical protein
MKIKKAMSLELGAPEACGGGEAGVVVVIDTRRWIRESSLQRLLKGDQYLP